jgi:hypothetical protein
MKDIGIDNLTYEEGGSTLIDLTRVFGELITVEGVSLDPSLEKFDEHYEGPYCLTLEKITVNEVVLRENLSIPISQEQYDYFKLCFEEEREDVHIFGSGMLKFKVRHSGGRFSNE